MPLITTAPTSQKADVRPISFTLMNSALGGPDESIALVVRPEDLTRVEPSRMAFQQTLDSTNQGWVDNFGPGLPTINISGHTGWRDIAGAGDGMAQFKKLNDMIFDRWHKQRQAMVNAGQNPDQIKLLFADKLDGFAYVVAPLSFTLRRSRSRPLLMQYQISMQTVEISIDTGQLSISRNSPSGDLLADLGLESLADVLNSITGYANDIASFIDGTAGVAARDFLIMTSKVLAVVNKTVGTLKGSIDRVTGSLLTVARDIMQGGRNLFLSVAAVSSFPDYVKYRLSQVASSFNTAFCILKNIFKTKKVYADYSDWYGASTCSSTAGGSPLSALRDQNAFYLLNPSYSSPFAANATAASSITRAVTMDPVISPPSLSETTLMLGAIASGVVVS